MLPLFFCQLLTVEIKRQPCYPKPDSKLLYRRINRGRQMDDQTPQPQALPEPIVKRREAITLYFVAVGAMAAVSVLTVVGGLVLAFVGTPAPGELWTFAGVALGALAGMVAGERTTA